MCVNLIQRAGQDIRTVKISGVIVSNALKILLTPADGFFIIILIPCGAKSKICGFYPGKDGIREFFLSLPNPLIQHRHILPDGIAHSITVNRRAEQLPLGPFFLHTDQCTTEIISLFPCFFAGFNALGQNDQIIWMLFQLLAQQFHVALLFFLHFGFILEQISVMMKNCVSNQHRAEVAFKGPMLVHVPLISESCGHTQQTGRQKVRVCPSILQLLREVIADNDRGKIKSKLPIIRQEPDKPLYIGVHPLVTVNGHVPFP